MGRLRIGPKTAQESHQAPGWRTSAEPALQPHDGIASRLGRDARLVARQTLQRVAVIAQEEATLNDEERYPRPWPLPGALGWGDDRHGLWIDVEFAGVTQRFRWIEPGEFLMGSDDDPDRQQREGPAHRVQLTTGLWLADTACTQGLWQAVMGRNPSHFKGERLPVESVSWDSVQQFLNKLRGMLPSNVEPVLPTEAQWEYACRTGAKTTFNFGAELGPEQANFNDSGAPKRLFRMKTVPVASMPANAWGLHEMHGNVCEWCADGLREYRAHAESDPVGPQGSHPRATRGGSWSDSASLARSACRQERVTGYSTRIQGFRLALRTEVAHRSKW